MRLDESIKLIVGEASEAVSGVADEGVAELVDAIIKARRVFVYGQGRSGHVTRMFAIRLMHLGLDVHFVGDTTTPPISRSDICLISSGTGETRFSYHVAMAVREAGARAATITANPHGRIARLSDIVVYIPAPVRGGPASVESKQPLGSLFEQATLLLLDAIVLLLMEKLGRNPQSLLERHANIE